MVQYTVHTGATIELMNAYLSDLHKNKDVFLRFRATKAIKNAAQEAARGLKSSDRLLTSGTSSTTKQWKLNQDLKLDQEELEYELLTEGSHYNFLKMHLLSCFMEQISKYGSLPQFCSYISKASHTLLKDTYRRSNHVDVKPQIVNTYPRVHTFGMGETNLAQWCLELNHIPAHVRDILCPTPDSILIPLGSSPNSLATKLQGRIDVKKIYNLATLATLYQLPELQNLTTRYLISNTYKHFPDPATAAARLTHGRLEPFNTLRIAVPMFNNDGHIIYTLRCTGLQLFRKKEQRHDWVFVWRCTASAKAIPGSFNGKIPARLNAGFKLTDTFANTSYRLAHITLCKVIGSLTPDSPEGMIRVGPPINNTAFYITDIEGIAHLILIEPESPYLVNNRIDHHTWNDIHDRNYNILFLFLNIHIVIIFEFDVRSYFLNKYPPWYSTTWFAFPTSDRALLSSRNLPKSDLWHDAASMLVTLVVQQTIQWSSGRKWIDYCIQKVTFCWTVSGRIFDKKIASWM